MTAKIILQVSMIITDMITLQVIESMKVMTMEPVTETVSVMMTAIVTEIINIIHTELVIENMTPTEGFTGHLKFGKWLYPNYRIENLTNPVRSFTSFIVPSPTVCKIKNSDFRTSMKCFTCSINYVWLVQYLPPSTWYKHLQNF